MSCQEMPWVGPGMGWIQSESLPCFRIAAAHNERDPCLTLSNVLGTMMLFMAELLSGCVPPSTLGRANPSQTVCLSFNIVFLLVTCITALWLHSRTGPHLKDIWTTSSVVESWHFNSHVSTAPHMAGLSWGRWKKPLRFCTQVKAMPSLSSSGRTSTMFPWIHLSPPICIATALAQASFLRLLPLVLLSNPVFI